MRQIVAAPLLVSEAPVVPRTSPRKWRVPMPIVRRGHARMRRLELSAAKPRGPQRPTTAIVQVLPTTGVPTRRRSRRAPTIRRPLARIRPREPIPRRAAAILLRRVPIPRRATAIAVAVEPVVAAEARTAAAGAAAVTAAVVAEAHTAAEVPVLTATANLFANSTARPDLPGGPFFLP